MKERLLGSLFFLTALAFGLQQIEAQQWTTNNLPAGLIAWWRADGDLHDSAGTNHLQADGNVTYSTGRFGQAFQFDGVSASAYCPGDTPALNEWTQFTMEAWISLDATNDLPNTPGRGIILTSLLH